MMSCIVLNTTECSALQSVNEESATTDYNKIIKIRPETWWQQFCVIHMYDSEA